ncbi:SemiSWEET family sugar transporter [Phenylobacterium sp.]|uniref:SemiSWEET family sugar transporter n=1 Tax=Phenylobacterium sp. TaxID=1871053 RepID=UPI00272EFBAA|nr:SemiSWEET transporter [Phenylobacterium sp.]MDP1874870.1 SemiSWEET transporter [Phenylobacterium sp.]MDP3488691.1 SemiSWEET transporter [Phenylobacterium sp.]
MEHAFLPEAIGFCAGLCSMVSFTPQIIKTWREKDARSISLRMYVVTVTGFGLWVTYGVMIGSLPVMLTNSVCLMLSALILAMKWRFSRPDHVARREAAGDAVGAGAPGH